MNYFKDLIVKGIYDPTINYQKMCLYLTFSGLLQQELDEIKSMWNNHSIRNSREAECSGGKPDVLYYTPSNSGSIEYKFLLNHTGLEFAKLQTKYWVPQIPWIYTRTTKTSWNSDGWTEHQPSL